MTDQNAGFTPPPQDPNSTGSGGFDPQSIMSGFQNASQDMNPQAWFEVWIKALTKPAEETYQEIISSPSANIYTGVIWILAALIVQVFFALASNIIWGEVSSEYSIAAGGSIVLAIFCFPIIAVFTLAIYLVITYAVHYFAMSQTTAQLPPVVTWERLFYVFAAIFTPLLIGGAVLSIIPILGGFLAGLLVLGGTGYMTMAVKSIYRLEWVQAFMVTGLIVLFGLCGLCF